MAEDPYAADARKSANIVKRADSDPLTRDRLPLLLTLQLAAHDLSIRVRTLEREIAAGRIGVAMVRGRPRIARTEIDAYIERNIQTRASHACPSENTVPVGRSASSLAVAALNELLAERKRTRRPSKPGFAASSSKPV